MPVKLFARLLRRHPPPESRALRALLDQRADEAAVAGALRRATLYTGRAGRGDLSGHPVPGLPQGLIRGLDPAGRTWRLFTAPALVRSAWRARPLPVSALDALRCAAGAGFTVELDGDPDGPPRLSIEPGRAGKLAAGLTPDGRGGWRVPSRLACAVDGPTRPCPDGLCAALGLIARREPGVASAHLVELSLSPLDRAIAMALTIGADLEPGARRGIVQRVEGHLATLFRGLPAPTVFIVTADQRSTVFDRGLPLFVRDGLGGTGIEVPDGHRVGLVLPSARPTVLALDTGSLLVDFGPDLEGFDDVLRDARARLGRAPGPVVWVIQRTALARLDPDREAILCAMFEAIRALGNPLVEQRAVVSAETSAGRALAERIGGVGVPVHALGSTREVAVEITGPEVGLLGLPGRFLAGPEPAE